ncbi:MAG: hypothetical protein AAFN74_23045, partial [Myxococcota bacterium]
IFHNAQRAHLRVRRRLPGKLMRGKQNGNAVFRVQSRKLGGCLHVGWILVEGTIDQLADAMSSQPLLDDRRAIWLAAHGRALHRVGDYTAARRDFVKSMRLDVANTDAASGLIALGADVQEPAWVDEGLVSLRARAAARGDWMRAFVAAALLVGRNRATTADRLTYERLRLRLSLQPQAALPADWLGRWLGLVSDRPMEPLPPLPELRIWRPEARLVEVISTVQGLFRAPEIEWRQDSGTRVWLAEGGIVVGRGVPRWPRRWRFEVGRALAAALEPRLARGLEKTDSTPTVEHLVVDRAGLIAAGDPAVALTAVGAHSPRGRRLVPFAVSDTLLALWRSVGLGLDIDAGSWPARRLVV